MSTKDPLNPTGGDTSKKTPLGDPATPPNPSTRDAVNRTGSDTGKTASSPNSGSQIPGAASTASPGATSSSGATTGATGATGATSGGSSSAQTHSSSGQNQHKEEMREELNATGEKVKSEARNAAREFTDNAKAGAEAQARKQQEAAAGELGGIAEALRKTADEVQGQSYLPLDQYARKAADKLDELSENLRSTDVRTTVGRLESYTRENPGVVLGGAIISGFLLARFMRASGERRSGSAGSATMSTHSQTGAGGYSTAGRSRPSTGSAGQYPGNGTPY